MDKGANPLSSGADSDLHRYQFSNENPAAPNDQEESSARAGSNVRPTGHDKKASYALSLQKACNVALQRVKHNNIIANTNWASPLAAAPSAISTMAILLKAADKEAAAGLEIESQEVKNEDGTVVGSLPSKYFHTNLQHCSDVGRLAFLDAQHGMSTIRATARSMIAEEGNLGYIIDLLEDPEDARYNLKPEIAALKKTANKCLANATAITAKFEYWYLVIIHLRQTSLTKKGQVVKEKEVTVTKKSDAAQDKVRYANKKQALEEKIKAVQKKLEAAERDVDRAQADVDRLRSIPVVIEPSVWEEIERVRRYIPMTPPPVKERGIFWDIKDAFVGKSKEHEDEDESIRRAHSARVQKLEDEALKQAKAQREYQRKLAANSLKDARELEAKTISTLNDAYNELSSSDYQLAEAKSNLEKAKGELELLNNKELELEGIMAILDNSTKNLGKLKEQIEPLVDFFKSILGEIDHNVDENLEAFLRPITQGIKNGCNPDEIEAIDMSRKSKERMMSTAMQMQGRFSAIADISAAYITVSTDYIRPAINEMESLSTMTDSEWQIRSQEFVRKCERLMTDIDGVAQETSANVDRNMSRHINALQRRAIEAATEHEE